MEATVDSAPTRLQVLEHAKAIAEKKGAVKYGAHLFEIARPGVGVPPYEPGTLELKDPAVREQVCGVCISGAAILAEIELTGRISTTDWLGELDPIAEMVLEDFEARRPSGRSYLGPFTGAITHYGTDYVVAVLDEAISRERELIPGG